MTRQTIYTANPNRLLESVVLFMDVLGFSEISKAAKTQDETEQLLLKMSKALRNACYLMDPNSPDFEPGNAPFDWDFKAFTDNIVMGCPLTGSGESELGHLIMSAAYYQVDMARHGFFTRGALAVGPHYMDDKMVFGPALIEAHEIETRMALYPRIVLSKRAVALAESHLRFYASPEYSPHHNLLARDADGQVFVNYLAILFESHDSEEVVEYLKEHADNIRLAKRKYQGNPYIWDKYRWVSSYHNWFCTDRFPGQTSLLTEDPVVRFARFGPSGSN